MINIYIHVITSVSLIANYCAAAMNKIVLTILETPQILGKHHRFCITTVVLEWLLFSSTRVRVGSFWADCLGFLLCPI